MLPDESDKHVSSLDATPEQGCDTPDATQKTTTSGMGCTSSEQLLNPPENTACDQSG